MLGKGKAPAELNWVVVMDRVGGYLGWTALQADAKAYGDVVTVLQAEDDARRTQKAEAEMRARLANQMRGNRGR